jgi:chorismate mutase
VYHVNYGEAVNSSININAWLRRAGSIMMKEAARYFVVRQKAVPEVLLKVVEAKKLLESEKVMTIQEAVDAVGISRSSFYKYKDDIFQFHDNTQGTTFTLTFQMDDEPGILSDVLKIIADYGANILTIHQSIPINGIASLSLSVQILQTTGDISLMIEQMEQQQGVHHVKILAKE